jgi:hypothetical protein
MKKKRQADPGTKQTLAELEELADKLGYRIRFEKGNFKGGYCILKESRLLVVNSRNDYDRRVTMISKSLKEIGIDDVYVKPGLREIIEKESKRKLTGEDEEEEISAAQGESE